MAICAAQNWFWLPALTARGGRWRLPLSPDAGMHLLAALVAAEPAARAANFDAAIRGDAGLALWVACQAGDDVAGEGVGELAAWLAEAASARLRWSADDGEPPAPRDDDRWAALGSTSLAVARRAAALARTQDGPLAAERAYLLGLLHAAPDCLSAAGEVAASAGQPAGEELLPAWLVTALRQLDAASPLPAVRRVREALAAASDETSTSGEAPGPAPGQWGDILPALADRLARLQQLESQFATALETAKLAAMREFAYGASHEINNPLANISTRAQTLLRSETDAERRRKLATINSQAFRAHEMISDIMLFAKPPRIEPARLDLAQLIAGVLAELSDDARQQGTQLRHEPPATPVFLFADRDHLAVALKAMLRNSLEALGVGGKVAISTRVGPAGEGGPGDERGPEVRIEISDSGPGIPPHVAPHLFDPFFSGREAGRGLGLGLSKCWRIVSLHGGRIEVDSPDAGGARFSICLPAAAAGSEAADAEVVAHG